MAKPRKLKLEGTSLHPSFFDKNVQQILEPLRIPIDEEQLRLRSPLLSDGDIVDLDSLVVLLKRAAGEPVDFAARDIRSSNVFLNVIRARTVIKASADQLSSFLWEHFSPETQTVQSIELDTPAHRLQVSGLLAKDLNRIIHGPLIFNRKRHSGLNLDSDTRELLDNYPSADRILLNRMILEDAFPAWLKGARPSPAVAFLWQKLPDATKALVRASGRDTHSEGIRVALVGELNRLIRGGSLSESQRFAKVTTLSRRTKDLLKLKPQGKDLARLNRLLLEDALPHVLRYSIYLRMNQADVDEFLIFPLALFEVVAAFTNDPDFEMQMRNFSLAWRTESEITASLFNAITRYVWLPGVHWTQDRCIIQYFPDTGSQLPSWPEVAGRIERMMEALHGDRHLSRFTPSLNSRLASAIESVSKAP